MQLTLLVPVRAPCLPPRLFTSSWPSIRPLITKSCTSKLLLRLVPNSENAAGVVGAEGDSRAMAFSLAFSEIISIVADSEGMS